MILFDKTIFGPVKSRRLGVSLGINLLPDNKKICNFNCVYCECGLTEKSNIDTRLPSRSEVKRMLTEKLEEMKASGNSPDALTFAGNGEPTMHPEFAEIIDDVASIRNRLAPSAKICVLSNASLLHKAGIVSALKKADINMLKIDAGTEETIIKMNKPAYKYSLPETIELLKQFNHKFTLQTMFMRGTVDGETIDNTSALEINSWVHIVKELVPENVVIYSIQRATPFDTIEEISRKELEAIAEKIKKLGINITVA